MKLLLIFLLLFITTISFTQEWQIIPNTNISYSNFKYEKPLGKFEFAHYQYFKKGDSLIALPDTISSLFFDVFASNENAFNDIYSTTRYITKKESLKDGMRYDEKFITISGFITAAIFIKYEIEDYPNGQLLITLQNTTWANYGMNPCETYIYFEKSKDKKNKNILKYRSTVKGSCQI